MTEADLRDFLEANKADIQMTVKSRMIERLLEVHRWDVSEAVTKVVKEFVDTNVVPAVREELESRKGVIVETVIKSLASISDDLASSLAADAAKNAGSEWQRKKIVQAIFGF